MPLGSVRIGRAVGELVVAEVGEARLAHAHLVEQVEHRDILAQRVGVLDAHVDDALAFGIDARGIVRCQSQFELLGVRGNHQPDRQAPQHREVAYLRVVLCAQRALRRVDGPETAIQFAVLHAGHIDLRVVLAHVVPLHDRPAGAIDGFGRVQMRVERDHLALEGHDLGQGHVLGGMGDL